MLARRAHPADRAGRGRGLIRAGSALAGAAAVLGAALWWRRNPSACPYSQRFWVEAPHPFITRERLREILDPRPGERVLEVGPGTGYYALPVAGWLAPGGRLEVSTCSRRCSTTRSSAPASTGIGNIAPTLADARSLPYGDDSFDAAYLVTVLGEIPDQDAALRELRRVVKPGGPDRGRRAVRRPAHGHPRRAGASARPRRGCGWSTGSAAGSGTTTRLSA